MDHTCPSKCSMTNRDRANALLVAAGVAGEDIQEGLYIQFAAERASAQIQALQRLVADLRDSDSQTNATIIGLFASLEQELEHIQLVADEMVESGNPCQRQ